MHIDSLIDYIHYLVSCKDKAFACQLRQILGFYPHNIAIYREALMHRSLNHHRPHEQKKDNERLEYLGDAVIETVVSDILYHQFPGKKEGFLTSVRSKIVQRSSLNRIAKETGLVELIQSTHINHTHNSFISGNAFEALVGAIYLDRGYAHCYRFFKECIMGKYIDVNKVAKEDDNFKSKLIEWGQKMQYRIDFELISENTIGTNSPTFRTRVCIEGIEAGSGFGYSKKESQQLAAKEAMRHIRKRTELYKNIVAKHDEQKELAAMSEANDLPQGEQPEESKAELPVTEKVMPAITVLDISSPTEAKNEAVASQNML
ncbi:MAG: ribonuclease III [Bacteroidaceae bacterium]|nr:ribonuclease III [Bacteroidaceae bacterium]